jgi:hypothetical protein
MKRIEPILLSILFALTPGAPAQNGTNYLTIVARVPLEGVEGRLDHMAADPASGRLFVSALENHSIEVIDLTKRGRVCQIQGVLEPQGIAFIRESGIFVVCSRGDGTCRSWNATTFEPGPWVDLGRNADNVRFSSGSIYAGSGAEPGPGLMSIIDAAFLLPVNHGGKQAGPLSPADLLPDRPRQGEIKFEAPLKAHPESFQIDAARNRIFVNVPDEHQIAVLDLNSNGLKVAQSWPVTVAEKNFPMALDADGSRLFIVCRKPACLAVYDTATGKMTGQAPCVGDADDMFYDSPAKRLYIIGGEGFVDVFQMSDKGGEAKRLSRVATAPKARTGLFIPELKTLAVAVPRTTNGPCEILLLR